MESYFRPAWLIAQVAAEKPTCTCRQDDVVFCEVCGCWNDCCLGCIPEPPCECVYIREDVTDAQDCQLHDPDSHYNYLLRKAEAKAAATRKPAGHEHVHPAFTDLLNSIGRAS